MYSMLRHSSMYAIYTLMHTLICSLYSYIQAIWTLLISINIQPKYDSLTSSALKYLTTVCSKQMNIALFTDTILTDIIQRIGMYTTTVVCVYLCTCQYNIQMYVHVLCCT